MNIMTVWVAQDLNLLSIQARGTLEGRRRPPSAIKLKCQVLAFQAAL